MLEVYKSWLKRTEHITEDCTYCSNQRYILNHPIVTSLTRDFRATMHGCPVCNWDDLNLNKKVSNIPLQYFVELKENRKTKENLAKLWQ